MHQLQITIDYLGEADGVRVDMIVLENPDNAHYLEQKMAMHLHDAVQDFLDQAFAPAEEGNYDPEAGGG